MAHLIHHLIREAAARFPLRPALRYRDEELAYFELLPLVERVSAGLRQLGIGRGDRVAVFLPKGVANVAALFGTAAAGGVFVPVNPLLKPEQLIHILRDAGARVLVTSGDRLAPLAGALGECPELRAVVVTDTLGEAEGPLLPLVTWERLLGLGGPQPEPVVIDADPAAILYTSGSTGQPKGVVLTHRNLLAGAESVAGYLQNSAEDRLLALLPLSFDYGLSQLTTALRSGACVVLMNYLAPQEVFTLLARERITGLAAVPALWMRLAEGPWPREAVHHLRYLTNSGGALPAGTLARLRSALPRTRIFLMYGLTEAFRSTYLPPEELDRRPGSIGRAIPNAEVLVVRPDGTPCEAGEQGELVHRGALVARGYWNAPELTAQRFRPLPGGDGVALPELAVWSGDTVYRDAEGFLYFVGRNDELIKSSGYRISPQEIEEVAYATGLVEGCVAVGPPHPTLGQGIVLIAASSGPPGEVADALLLEFRRRLPAYMVPLVVEIRPALPQTPNGKLDRTLLAREVAELFLRPEEGAEAEAAVS